MQIAHLLFPVHRSLLCINLKIVPIGIHACLPACKQANKLASNQASKQASKQTSQCPASLVHLHLSMKQFHQCVRYCHNDDQVFRFAIVNLFHTDTNGE